MNGNQREADFAPLPAPGTILRRNPRDERSQRRRAPIQTHAPRRALDEVLIIEDAEIWIAAFLAGEGEGGLALADRDLLTAARSLAGPKGGVLAIVRDMPDGVSSAKELAMAGADRVILLGGADTPDCQAENIGKVAGDFGARHVLFTEDAVSGDVARRLAMRFNETPASRVRHLTQQAVICEFDGGTREVHMSPPRVILLPPDYPNAAAEARLREARVVRHVDPVQVDLPGWSIGQVITPPASSMPLREADFVVSAGAGVSDWTRFRMLASHLNAAIGGSRVVCDQGDLPRDRQVGASGVQVDARAYLAFGISGAPQHLEGIQACQHVISVNTDPKANIVSRANLAICADAQAVMGAMIGKLEAANG